MADTQRDNDETHAAVEKQIAELRRQVTKINRTLADQAEEAAEQAAGWIEGASNRASRAAQQLRSQAQTVSEVARDNPATTSIFVGVVGLAGFLLGIAVGQSMSDRDRWR